MKISTEIQSIVDVVGDFKALEYIGRAGFDAWDFSMFNMKDKGIFHKKHPLVKSNYLDYARKMKQVGLDNGITCNQSHAPFPSFDKHVRLYLKRAIECTAEAGGKYCIIHPGNNKTPQENAELFMELLPFAKEYGVKIATENMWNWDNIKNHALPAACSDPQSFNANLDVVNDDYLVACLDLGHAEMKGLNTSAVDMILKLENRLKALHMHDNDKWHDSHQIPFSMDVNFDEIVKALKKINYDGYFTLEADQYMGKYNKDNAFEGVQKMADAAKKLADMFENCEV